MNNCFYNVLLEYDNLKKIVTLYSKVILINKKYIYIIKILNYEKK